MSGTVILFGGTVVWCKAKQQTLIATSTMESETIALSETLNTVLFIRRILDDLGHTQAGPTMIEVDNQSTIAFARSIMVAWKNRHIPLRDFRIREMVANGTMSLEWVPSDDNVADLFTKSLGVEPLTKHRDSVTADAPNP